MGKVTITLDKDSKATVDSELNGHELYNAYVALSAHIATKLARQQDITRVANQASSDALKLLRGEKTPSSSISLLLENSTF